jgi:hypothetical protein
MKATVASWALLGTLSDINAFRIDPPVRCYG